ncbi:MAG: NAD-dependent epimerase/dehydratase family protein [Deinococcales bacterium]
MKVLVTGATGFIGGNVARALLGHGYRVRALVRPASDGAALQELGVELTSGDLCDEPSLATAVAGCQAVVHVGAIYTLWAPRPDVVYRTNVRGTRNLLEAAARAGAERIVFTSSESTLLVPDGGLGSERAPADFHALPGAYKRSKFLSEQLAMDMAAEGVPLVVVHPTTPVGVGDVKPTPTGAIIVDFLNGRMPAYVDTGLNLIDVEDVAEGHVLALERGRDGERYVLGNENVTLKDVLVRLARITGLPAPRWRLPHWVALGAAHVNEALARSFGLGPPRVPLDGVRASRHYRHFDCSKAVTELGLPQTPVDEALAKAVAWFTTHGSVHRALPGPGEEAA